MKRADLQGLRGLAILAVFLYHLWPLVFPYGFVGVDMFFVLSGFFMARAFERHEVTQKTSLEFYKRRLKRILPCYALLLFVLQFVASIFYILSDVDDFRDMSTMSLIFSVNHYFVKFPQGYWSKDRHDSWVTLHLWSLAVEVQFYLITPLIVAAIRKVDKAQRVAVLLVSSAVLLVLNWANDDRNAAFFLLPYRLWQFFYGFAMHEVELSIGSPNNKKTSSWPTSLFVIFLVVMMFPKRNPFNPASGVLFSINEMWYNTAATFITGIIVVIGERHRSRLLENRFMIYLGDISYVLYLAHWPAIALARYWWPYYQNCGPIHIMLTSSVISIALSVVVHHYFEKPLLKAKDKSAFGVSVVLYAAVIVLVVSEFPKNASNAIMEHAIGHNSTLKDLIHVNFEAFSGGDAFYTPPECKHDTEAEAWTRYTEQPEYHCVVRFNGSGSILILGNSVSHRAFPLLLKLLNGRFATLRFFVHSGIYDMDYNLFGASDSTRKLSPICSSVLQRRDEGYNAAVDRLIVRMRPDAVMIPEYHGMVFSATNEAVQRRIDFIAAHAKNVHIDYPYTTPEDIDGAKGLTRRLSKGILEFPKAMSKRDRAISLYSSAIQAIDAVQSTKLIKNDIRLAFCRRDPRYCEGYNPDTLISYMGRTIHLSANGYQVLEPYYRRVIEEIVQRITSIGPDE